MLLFRSPTGILQVLVATAALALVSAQGNGNGNANGNGNGPPAFVANLPEKVQEKFQRDNLVKRDKLKDLPLQSVWHGGPNNNGAPVFLTTRLCGVRVVSLGGLKPVLAASKTKTTCEKDGQEVTCPDPLVYTKEENDAKITVSMNPNNAEEVETVQVVVPGCGAETFVTVTPGLVTSIPVDAYDEDELSKYVYGDVDGLLEDVRGRHLRYNKADGRGLQSGCTTKKNIKLALGFDSSYCSKKGGYNNAVAALTTAVAGVSALYEATTCFTVGVSHFDGYCNAAVDVYKAGVDLNQSGCGATGMLTYFRDYWENNKSNVDRDLAHFAGGTGLECSNGSCVIGCAWVNSLCRLSTQSYGVNYMTFSSNNALLNSLLAHEMGHNAGSSHDTSTNSNGVDLGTVRYIMEPRINDGSSGFSPYSQNEFDIQPQGCLEPATLAPEPTASPTLAPITPEPTRAPVTASPSKAPVTTPPSMLPTSTAPVSASPTTSPVSASPTTAEPTGSPTTDTPSISPTSEPTGAPTTGSPSKAPSSGSPTKSPTDAPTLLPTPEPTDAPTTEAPTGPPTTDAPTPLPTLEPTDTPTTAQPTGSPITDDPTPVPTPLPTDANLPSPDCRGFKEFCTEDSDCCSAKCRGPPNRMTCKV